MMVSVKIKLVKRKIFELFLPTDLG